MAIDPTSPPTPPNQGLRPHTPLRSILRGVLLGIVFAAFVTLMLVSQPSGRSLISRTFSSLTGRTLTIDVSQPAVVDRIQKLQRLETVVYTMDKVVTGAKENPLLPDFLTGDRLLMLVHGEAVAGIDFSTLRPADVHIDGRRVRLHLPTAQVFASRLDESKTRVYSRQTGLLVPTDPNLETRVRQAAEQQILEAALADGILQNAQQNATSTLTGLLHSLGFEKVDFD